MGLYACIYISNYLCDFDMVNVPGVYDLVNPFTEFVMFVCFAGSTSELSVFANQENLTRDACVWLQEQLTARTRLLFTICILHPTEGLFLLYHLSLAWYLSLLLFSFLS